MIRLFVGIELPPELRLRLSLLCAGLPGARWVDAGNLHLTLRFIGEVDEGMASDIDAALARIRAPRFEVALAGAGTFGGERPRLLWIGVEDNKPLLELQERVEAALRRAGVPPDTRRYSPHVTLARLKRPDLARVQGFLAANALFRAPPVPVERFSLIASYPAKSGAVYEDQADYPLR
jgi:RNA 2',3'-cyclic 3'-phosphodiesterase